MPSFTFGFLLGFTFSIERYGHWDYYIGICPSSTASRPECCHVMRISLLSPGGLLESPSKTLPCDRGLLDSTSSYSSHRFLRYNHIRLRLPRHRFRVHRSWYLSSAPMPVSVIDYTSARVPSFQRLLNQHKKSYSRSFSTVPTVVHQIFCSTTLSFS